MIRPEDRAGPKKKSNIDAGLTETIPYKPIGWEESLFILVAFDVNG